MCSRRLNALPVFRFVQACLYFCLLLSFTCPVHGKANGNREVPIEIVPQIGHSGMVTAIAYSNNGNILATGNWAGEVKLWEIKSGSLLRTLRFPQTDRPSVEVLAFNRDDSIVSAVDNLGNSQSWKTISGKPIFDSPNDRADAPKQVTPVKNFGWRPYALSPDNQYIAVGGDSGIEIRRIGPEGSVKTFGRPNVVVSNHATVLGSGKILQLFSDSARTWNTQTGELERAHDTQCCGYALSRDGTRAVIEPLGKRGLAIIDSNDPTFFTELDLRGLESTWDIGLRWVQAISDNGKLVVIASDHNLASIFDTTTGKRIATFKTGFAVIRAVSFSTDGTTFAICGTFDMFERRPELIEIRDTETGRLLNAIKTKGFAYDAVQFSPGDRFLVAMGSESAAFDLTSKQKLLWSKVGTFPLDDSISISADSRLVLLSMYGGLVELRSLDDGKLLAQVETHEQNVTTTFTADTKAFVTTGDEGVMKMWTLRGQQIATFHAGEGWVTITPAGFFASDSTSPPTLKIIRGMHAYDISQVYQALYRPDLVETNLGGDRFGKYLQASSTLNLRSLLDTGAPPLIRILDTKVSGTEVKVKAEAADQGGGIGKIEWRLNGRTIDVEGRGMQVLEANEQQSINQQISLAPGIRNVISITGYNSQGLVASTPLELTIDTAGATTEPRGSLYVLAIGVDKYSDGSLTLRDAVSDARAIGRALSAVGNGIYDKVKVVTLLDGDVSASRIDTAFRDLSLQIKPEDKFVFFIAGHGLTRNGKYYFLPQDFGELDTYLSKGIDQDKWQAWFASIKARSSVLLYDTCESGTIARDVTSEKSAAMDRLSQAVGINVIAASDADQPAQEGYKGHGLFTWAVLDGLANGDENNDRFIEIFELANHVGSVVREVSRAQYRYEQRPRVRMFANFPLGLKDASLEPQDVIAREPNRITIRKTSVESEGKAVAELKAYTLVRLLKIDGSRALIAKDGEQLGYVPADALAEIN